MEWKDTGEMEEKDKPSEDGYFDEEQYSSWAGQEEQKKQKKITKLPILFFLLVLAIVALVVALLMLVTDGSGDSAGQQKIAVLEGRVKQLEDRLDKYESMDEKVTQIWGQAKSFEEFKERFNRSEASMTLRMDHLTMSLEAMQKKPAVKSTAKTAGKSKKKASKSSAPKVQYHQVKAGETLYSISKRYGLKVNDLRKMNKISSNEISVGQKLVVRTSAK